MFRYQIMTSTCSVFEACTVWDTAYTELLQYTA
jgi:hypothetical protein